MDVSPDDKLPVAVTPPARYGRDYGADALNVLSPQEFDQALQAVRELPLYAPTPLVDMPGIADECGVAAVSIKDEGSRLPTRSFKLLGPPYALFREVRQWADSGYGPSSSITAIAATSGNHGRALAWGCQQFGCRCRIYTPSATGAGREQAIQQYGAETVRVAGNYDMAVDRAARDAQRHGYLLIGDGAPPNSRVMRHILHGYSVLGAELISQTRIDKSPTHVFIPAGSGMLAAAVTARLWMKHGADRPQMIVVQPHCADSAYQSCLRARRFAAQGDLKTMMDGLSVGEVAPMAWKILREGAFAFITISDEIALQTLRRFARENLLAIGETGIAAVAGFIAAASDKKAREQLGIDNGSRVILIATEGVTDQAIYDRLTG